MKYCPKCKTRAAGDEAVCPKCGGALRTIGAPIAGEAPTAAGSEEQLVLRLAGLQHEVGRSRKTMLVLGALTAALSLFLLLLLVSIYVQRVKQYAMLGNVDVVPSETNPGAAEISFSPSSAGKVEFVRETAGRTETLIEYADASVPLNAESASLKFLWAGGKSGESVIRVRYRDGWSIGTREWTLRAGR